MHVFRKKLVRMGGSCWLDDGDGKWMDLGRMTGRQIVQWCLVNRTPLMDVTLRFPEPVKPTEPPAREKDGPFRGVYADRKIVGRY